MKYNHLKSLFMTGLALSGGVWFGSSSALAIPVIWPGNGNAYEVVVPPSLITWPNANVAANAMGGHLVTITSAAENAFVYSLVSNSSLWFNQGGQLSGPWLGGFRTGTNWNWVTGETFFYANWELNQPDNEFGQENVLQYFAYGILTQPKWNDSPNNAAISRAFIVEYEVPEPSSLTLIGAGAAVLLTVIRSRRSLA